jgi:lipopolysaccharide assembly outer membrane protein LptD (OstA)
LSDTLVVHGKKSKKTVLETEVNYSAEDSFRIVVGEEKIYLYRNAKVAYQDINLESDYIEFDMSKNTVMAAGSKDTAGVLKGKPNFSKGNEKFDSDTIKYNFESQKGIIKFIVTQQGEGYLHSNLTKRFSDGRIDVKNGKYTTCDAPHPHFYIALTKAIAIPRDKIVSGPAYLVLEDIPLPLAIPSASFQIPHNGHRD